MQQLISVYLFSLALVIVLKMAWDHYRGRVELLSIRNLALVGLIIFQVTSAALRLWQDRFDPFLLSDPTRAGFEFACWVTLFTILTFVSYNVGWIAKPLARRIPVATVVPNALTMLFMALILVLMGMALRLGTAIPLVAILADFLGTGFCAMAAGLVGWVWGKRLLNPVLIVYGVIILGIGMFTVMYGAFGRRGLVAIGGGLLWGMYYANWRNMSPVKMWVRLAAVSAVPLIFIALYTDARSAGEHDRTTAQHIRAMTSASVLRGTALLLDGQNTGTETLWLIENYPERFNYRPLFTLWYTVGVTVPRVIWPDKPVALSNTVATDARIRQVNRDKIKLSPGVIGSAAAEGGWYAVILYGIAFGLFLRFFDEIIRLAPWSPFAVLPVASGLGQVLGLARGETSVFANTYILTVAGCWITMLAVGRFVQVLRGGAGYEAYVEETQDSYGDETYDYEPAAA